MKGQKQQQAESHMSWRGSQAIDHLDRKVSAVERMFAPSCIKPCFFYTHGRASRHRDGNTLSAASKAHSLVHKELFHLGPVPVIFTIRTFGSCHVALSQTWMRTRETKGWNDAACMGRRGEEPWTHATAAREIIGEIRSVFLGIW
jgi:hypothetical protein